MASKDKKRLDELNEQIARSGMARQIAQQPMDVVQIPSEQTAAIDEAMANSFARAQAAKEVKPIRPQVSLHPHTTTSLSKRKEEEQPQEAQGQQTLPSAFETSMAEMVRKQEEYLAQQRAKRDKLQQEIMAARDAEGSFVANWFRQNEPKYDAEAEKRAKQAARIKAIGEALGLVASGFAAFGKNGMGYVPKFESSALKDIEKINETREKYLAQREAWKEFDYKQRLASLQARTKAAEALKEAKDDDIDAGEKTLARYKEMMQKHQSDKEIATIKGEQAKEKQAQGHEQKLEQIGKRNEGAIAAKQAGAANKAQAASSNAAYFALWKALNPNEEVTVTQSGGNIRGTKTTTKPKTYTKNQEAQFTEATKNDWSGKLLDEYLTSGMSLEAAIAEVVEINTIKNSLNVAGASVQDRIEMAKTIRGLVKRGKDLEKVKSFVLNKYESQRQ